MCLKMNGRNVSMDRHQPNTQHMEVYVERCVVFCQSFKLNAMFFLELKLK